MIETDKERRADEEKLIEGYGGKRPADWRPPAVIEEKPGVFVVLPAVPERPPKDDTTPVIVEIDPETPVDMLTDLLETITEVVTEKIIEPAIYPYHPPPIPPPVPPPVIPPPFPPPPVPPPNIYHPPPADTLLDQILTTIEEVITEPAIIERGERPEIQVIEVPQKREPMTAVNPYVAPTKSKKVEGQQTVLYALVGILIWSLI